MTRNFIFTLTVLLLSVSLIPHNMEAQSADSSIFRKPLKIKASVKRERATRSEQKGDTLIFNAAAYQVLENSDSERLISKMPGISVSDNGIEANGKEISRILLDGQEFFGNDVLTALRNIPADMVKQIEILNRLSDSAQLTGVDDGEGQIAINIVTKRKRGTGVATGRLYGSYGLSDQSEHRHNYIAGGHMTHFTDERTISLIGMSNNINKFNFSNSNIVSGATGLDASGGSSFKVKALSGISDVNSLGANYTSKKCNFSYFFNDITNTNRPTSDKFTMTATEGQELHTHNESDYEAHNMTHRLDGKINLSPTKKHSFIIRPTLSFDDMYNGREQYGHYSYVYTDKADEFQRQQINISNNDRWTIRGSINANYRYRFAKKRRSLGISGKYSIYRHSAFDRSWEYKWRTEDADLEDRDAADKYFQNRDKATLQHSGSAKFTYTEPITRRSLISGEYIFSMTDTENENLVFPFSDGAYSSEPKTRVSAINRAAFYQNKAGVRYNYNFKKITIAASAHYLNTIYSGRTQLPSMANTERSYHHPIYMLSANIPVNKSNTVRIEAKSKTQNPSSSLLQNIVDRSSTSNVRAGNPDLDPAYLHETEIRYINTNKGSGTTFSFTTTYTGSSNYFCDSLVINRPDFIVMTDENGKNIKLGKNNQYVKPINMGGYHKLMVKTSFAMPLDFLRCNFNIGAQASVNRLPGMINEEAVPINRNWFQLSGRLDSNISKEIDFTVSYLARYTMNDYTGKFGAVQNNFITHRAQAALKWIFFRDFTFTGAFVYKNYKSTEGRYNDNFYLCDLFIGRRFLKNRRLEASIGVNDLFNNNRIAYSHSVNASGKTDGTSIGLGRYFSAQLIYHFRSDSSSRRLR